MRLPRGRAGFSLTELIIAMLLSSFVMIGIVGISSQMVRFQVEGMRKGTVTGWSLVAITAMNREIEDGTTLIYPTNASGAADSMSLCHNYTHLTNAAIGPGSIRRIDYCYDSTAPGYLRRNEVTGSCPAIGTAPPACSTFPEVVATGIYRDVSGNMVFRRADDVGGVQTRYRVGNPSPTTNNPMPQTLAFDMKFAMNKQYSNSSD